MAYSIVLSALVAYLLGSINTSIIVSKLFGISDIRNEGSGNAGATNTLRVLGAKAAAFVVIGDALKGIIAVIISRLVCASIFDIDNSDLCSYIAAVMVVLGHIFPLYFKFRGGKGIMTSIAVIFLLDYRIGLILVGIFAVLIFIFNYVSLASCVSALAYPFLVICFHNGNDYFLVSAIIIALLAIIKHRTNIQRLLNGTESKLFKSKTNNKR